MFKITNFKIFDMLREIEVVVTLCDRQDERDKVEMVEYISRSRGGVKGRL